MGSRSIVAIVGAGTLGGALAHTLAGRNTVDEIRLIDSARDVATGKALDIQQAGSVEGFHTRVVAQGDTSWAIGATVVVLAGPIGGAEGVESADEWDTEHGLSLLARMTANDHRAVFVCAGSSHAGLVERGVAELGVPRERLLGSAPLALESALRAIVAVELRSAASQVSVSALGRPPGRMVVPWSQATVGGYAIGRLLAPTRLARLEERVSRLWAAGTLHTRLGCRPYLGSARGRERGPSLSVLRVATGRARGQGTRRGDAGQTRGRRSHERRRTDTQRARAGAARDRPELGPEWGVRGPRIVPAGVRGRMPPSN